VLRAGLNLMAHRNRKGSVGLGLPVVARAHLYMLCAAIWGFRSDTLACKLLFSCHGGGHREMAFTSTYLFRSQGIYSSSFTRLLMLYFYL
jgi:hypothetical protein